jgi:ABC-2 type transport system ATP-binding protein
VLAALQRSGINAASVTVARPSLDEVYLRHTGRRYRESGTPDRNADPSQLQTAEASK